MNDEPIMTRPPSSGEKILKDKFAENIAGQNDLMDQLGKLLITLELAIPGLYATVLKMTKGSQATVKIDAWLVGAFILWFSALMLTLFGLIPRNWKVDRNIMKQDPDQKTDVLGIEDFFRKSAQYKRRFIILASVIYFIGIISAVFSVL